MNCEGGAPRTREDDTPGHKRDVTVANVLCIERAMSLYFHRIVEKSGTGRFGATPSGEASVSKSPIEIVGGFKAALAECRAAEQLGEDISSSLRVVLDSLYPLILTFGVLRTKPEVAGLRFARARLVHQNASLTFRDTTTGESRWRPSSQMPRPQNMKQHWNHKDQQAYDGHLEPNPVMDALRAAELAVDGLSV